MIDKQYTPKNIEAQWNRFWEENNVGTPHSKGKPYCIMIPPPNVTGTLHMGHGFQMALMDASIRFQRMKGCNTLWQVGTDHAGIATQMVVERQLNQKNQTKEDLGRENFLKKMWEWIEQSGGQITHQMRRMGLSVDWSRERFTLDEGLSDAVQEVFIRLHEKKLIYRGKKLVNWDTQLKTAVSDLEVVNEETHGQIWYIRYPLENSSSSGIIVATTRPETLFGDVAIAVHPDDPRYQQYLGQKTIIPLTERRITVIADEHVNPEFGTGAVKVTPAHDFNDYEIGQRHSLPLINIMNADGTLNEEVPQSFQGMDRLIARKHIVSELKVHNFITEIKAHKLIIPKGDRSKTVLEPRLTDQWYVHMKPLAEPALKAVREGKVVFHPANTINTYEHWLNSIQDWCISRQLWWGHRIPAWYDSSGNVYVGRSEEEIRTKHQLDPSLSLHQDEDVLDTWFSSALWPFSTLGWPNETPDYKTFFPTQLLVTGHDILFFWVARMIMMSLEFTGHVPFKDVVITGLIRDFQGKKVSKTNGNGIDPLDLIDGASLETLIEKRTQNMMQPNLAAKIAKATRQEYPNGIQENGTDALRFTFCALATTGRDVRFDYQRLVGYRNFCNKIWNAARFTLIQTTEIDPVYSKKPPHLYAEWIEHQFNHCCSSFHKHMNEYRFDLAAQCVHHFIWNELCDWYLEWCKPLFQQGSPETLGHLLMLIEKTMRLAHPLLPYITEEIWKNLKPFLNQPQKCIMECNFPEEEPVEQKNLQEVERLQNCIVSLRTLRSEMNISPKHVLTIFLESPTPEDLTFLQKHFLIFQSIANINEFTPEPKQNDAKALARCFSGGLRFLLPIEGLVNASDETKRVNKTIEKLNKEASKLDHKLNHTAFKKNAPEQALLEEIKLKDLQEKMKRFNDHLLALAQLAQAGE